ncbi:hypothetical protein ACSL103130_02690 [Actinomyces slackii]|uniref:Uncharacterized protein n=1 Tax=Actinomyces slackii TaxID=52774 RepID=A0A448KE98_9ACTO|nr:hypothetical protein [Actinomyces slackii]VEG75241.1 Uncharacterised protein [Actinomyces slackii]
MSIDWASLALVTAVTVLGTAFIMVICSWAARMLDEVHIKRSNHEVKGLHAAELSAGVLLFLAGLIVLYGLWLIIPYFH